MNKRRRTPKSWLPLIALTVALTGSPVLRAQNADHQGVLDAREALRRGQQAQLAAARAATLEHPLASWVQYWELSSRLDTAQADEIEAFYTRWAGTYVEDRLRNDWLLELGKRRDWDTFVRDYPRFRMNDDREVLCYHLLTQHLQGREVRDTARSAWFAQRNLDDGCQLLARTLFDAGVLGEADAWHKARLATEQNRRSAARAAAELVGPAAGKAVDELFKSPARFLKRRTSASGSEAAQLETLALLRLAAEDPAAAVPAVRTHARELPPPLAAYAWAGLARQAALALLPEAADHYQHAWTLRLKLTPAQRDRAPWSDETLAWQVRAALRSAASPDERWRLVGGAIDAMSPAEQRDAAWVYWRARALQGSAKAGAAGDADRQVAAQLLESISGQMNFYGKLATEDLGRTIRLPAAPMPLSSDERAAAERLPGLQRALLLIDIGLRNEGVREWNFTLRGMNDRELLAAAQLACDREVWDRCINTSDRTRAEVDMAQRFPMPYRQQVVAQAREIGLDPAYVYGLIRQESRFITDARSSAGASGLMQLMPATAKWTARKLGIDYRPGMVVDRDLNLKLGTAYLKLVLDDFGGSQALAAAAYNAGPGRPRRWREGALLEAAAWAENVPFNETRDYVKKVLSNATYYSSLIEGRPASLKARLGGPVGPRGAAAGAANEELP